MILEAILHWSKSQPAWQQDALRRLVCRGELEADDIHELTEICKDGYDLAEQQVVQSLAEGDVRSLSQSRTPVSLNSVHHKQGVNALATDQTLTFSPNLTLVYGDNAAGKTGYIRILKSACRERGTEEILGNVLLGGSLLQDVVIRYQIGDDQKREWSSGSSDNLVAQVSVFDSRSASVYLTEKTDVAFRPFGLDLFDKLVQTCKAVRQVLESERDSLEFGEIQDLQSKIAQETSVGKFLAKISRQTRAKQVSDLATLSDKEHERLSQIERSLKDLQANDSGKAIRELKLRLEHVQVLTKHVDRVKTALEEDSIADIVEKRSQGKKRDSKQIRSANRRLVKVY